MDIKDLYKKNIDEDIIHELNYLISLADQIPSWYVRGEKVIIPEKFNLWVNALPRELTNLNNCGFVVDTALTIMEMLKDGKSYDEIKQYIKNSPYSYLEWIEIHYMVLAYYADGEDYIRNVCDIQRDKFWEEYIEEIKEKDKKRGYYRI